MIELIDISGDEGYSGTAAILEFAERASVPEAALIASAILSCQERPLAMAAVVIGLLHVFADQIEGSDAHLSEMIEGFRAAIRADVARYEGASA